MMKLTATDKVRTLDINDIASVYSGKSNVCCCGCAGTHWTKREYPRTWQREFKRVLKVVQENFDEVRGDLELNGTVCNWAAVDMGKRQYIVYLTKEAVRRLTFLNL
jgi:hypothetical protein